MHKEFYEKVAVLYERAKHGAISGDDFCYEVGILLEQQAAKQSVQASRRIMSYEDAKNTCHVRSAIYRESKGVKYWKNHSLSLDECVSDEDKKADDWKEFDPRDEDNSSLFMFND